MEKVISYQQLAWDRDFSGKGLGYRNRNLLTKGSEQGMNRVLSVIHTPVYGGPHNQMLRLHGPLAARGWETIVVLPDEPGNGAERLRAAGVTTVQIPLHRLRKRVNPRVHFDLALGFLPEVGHIRRLIRQHHIDLVQICGLMNPHGAIAARLESVPVVWQLLSTFAPMPLRLLLMPLVMRLSSVVMSTGIEVARAHPGATKLEDRLVTFFPPLDTAEFRPDPVKRSVARAELGVPDNAFLIGTVGNLNRQKGHEFLVRAADIVCRAYRNTFFRVLGAYTPTNADYYERTVKAEALKLGLMADDRLRFVDPGSRVADYLPAFDLFLLTSRAEGIPTSILEAMSCGLPVIATDVGSMGEVVEDGVTGFVVPPLSHEAIAGAIFKLLCTPELRLKMGQEARRRAVERYDVKVCVEAHLRAYEAAIASKLVGRTEK